MKLALHQHAADNFNLVGSELASVLRPATSVPPGRTHPSFRPYAPVAATISPDDLVGDVIISVIESSGREIAVEFGPSNRMQEIKGPDYVKFDKLCRGLEAAIGKQALVSRDLIRKAVLSWMGQAAEARVSRTMSDYVLDIVGPAVQERSVWVPIACLHVEVPIKIGVVTIREMEWEKYKAWMAECLRDSPNGDQHVRQHLQRAERTLRGLAGAETTVLGDAKSAEDVAFQRAEEAASILRMFSDAALLPHARSFCTLLGCENRQKRTAIRSCEGEIDGVSDANVYGADGRWVLNANRINNMRKSGLDRLAQMYGNDKKGRLQDAVLAAVMIYSHVPLLTSFTDKLIYALAALECVLLRNASEPVQQNLGERLALLVGSDLAERKSIVGHTRHIYDIRSRFVHHGKSVDDAESLGVFMSFAWHAILRLADLSERYGAVEDVLSALDDQKLR